MFYFKSTYTPGIIYSQGWYGTLDYAPAATILMYDDENGFCIGQISQENVPGIEYITEEIALSTIDSSNGSGVWKGIDLYERW